MLRPEHTKKSDWFVSPEWLAENLHKPDVKVIDGTWALPGSEVQFPKAIIPGAQFVDLDSWKSNTPLGAPYHPIEIVKRDLSDLGIDENHHVILYDKQGFFSAPRIAWSLKAIGHERVSILRGGLPAWLKKNSPTENIYQRNSKPTDYKVKKPLVQAATIQDVVSASKTDHQIIDARSTARFSGKAPEPRPGLRSGHIPESFNIPLSYLKNANGNLLTSNQIRNMFEKSSVDLGKPIMTTCGSGVTAAALAWILFDIGKHDVAVYSGSWAEYGASDYPIETK